MNPSFTDITYFMEVAETQNISRAAERLGITQPSLSSAVRRVEDSLGLELLLRSRTGVKLTKAGQEFFVKSRSLLVSWNQLKSEVTKKQNEICGDYIIGCHPSVALYSLSHFLPALIHKYKDLNVSFQHDLSRKITEGVISFEIDFGIVVSPVSHPDLVIRELCKDEVSFWTSKKPSPTQNLDPQNGVLICDMDLLQSQKLLLDLQKKKKGFRRIIRSGSLEVITDLTKSGVGVGLLPQRVALKNKSYNLKLLDKSLPCFKYKICLIYRADIQKTMTSRTIIDAIKAAKI